MKMFRYISSVLAGLSVVFSLAGCQEEISSEGQAVLADVSVLTFEAKNAAEQTIQLKADGKWTAEVSKSWITVTPASGEGHTDVVITVSDNIKNGAMDEPREGTVRFSAADGRNYGYLSYATFTLSVNQKGDSYLTVAEETTVTQTAALWDTEPAKVKDAQVAAITDKGFVITDGTTSMFVESAAEVKVGDVLSLNGTKTTVNGLPYFNGDEVTVVSTAQVTYPEAVDITADLSSYTAEAVSLVKVTGTLIGTKLLGIAGEPSKGVEIIDATRTMELDKVAVHEVEITGYWLGLNDSNHVIAIKSYEDKGENLSLCEPFPFRDNFSWLQPFVEESKTLVASSKWPKDAVGENVNTGTDLPNLYTEIKSCLKEFQSRGYADYMPEYKSIFLADGYLKFSISKKPTGIVLPLLAISGEQDIYVQFNWCAEKNGSGKIDDVHLVVEIDGPGKFEKPSEDNPKMSESLSTTQVAEHLAWQYASVRINGATMATKISIHPVETAGMRRYFLDNIAVVSLADAVPANISVEGPANDLFKFEGTPEGSQSFTVTSDKEFFVNSSANWVKVDVTEGKAYEKTTVNVTCEPSTLSTLREAAITVTSGSTSYSFIVIQSAAGMELEPFVSVVGGNSINISEEAEDINIEIQANVEFKYEVTEGAEWLSVVETPAVKALVETTPIALKAAANTVPVQRIGKVRFYNEEEGVEAVYTVIQKEKLPYEIIAKWVMDATTADAHKATFDRNTLEGGISESYIAAAANNGTIQYYQVDKQDFGLKADDAYRKINDSFDAVCRCPYVGDYWLIKATREGGAKIPAGSRIEFTFATRISAAAPQYWIVEYLDGETWKPAMATSTVTVDGKDVLYNISHTSTGIYPHDCMITTSSEMNEIQFRILCPTPLRYNGTLPTKPTTGNISLKGADYSPVIKLYYE